MRGKERIRYVITVAVMAVSVILYIINCQTAYYKSSGINSSVMIASVAAIAIELVIMLAGEQLAGKIGEFIMNILPVAASVLYMYAFMTLLNSRIYSIATIMTFEKNEANIADMKTGIVAMAAYLLAVIIAVIVQCHLLKKADREK